MKVVADCPHLIQKFPDYLKGQFPMGKAGGLDALKGLWVVVRQRAN